MNKNKIDTISETQRAEAVSRAMKLIIDFDDLQLKEIRRFVETLMQIRQKHGSNNE